MNAKIARWLPLLLAACAAPAPAPGVTAPAEGRGHAADVAMDEFTVIALAHTDAAEVGATLRDFLADLAAGEAGTGGEGPRVLSDPRTNSLLIVASPERTRQIEALVARIDAE